MTDPDLEEYECPSCKGIVDLSWKVCPHCGAKFELDTPEPPQVIERAPPSPDPPSPAEPATAAPVPAASTVEFPPEPIVPEQRAPITLAPVPPVEDDLRITKTSGASAPLSIVEAYEPNLAPTVLPAPGHGAHGDELAELERMITAAVAKAMKANEPAAPAGPPPEIAMLAPSAAAPPASAEKRRRGLAWFGLGLLAGGAFGVVVGMNWDVWVRHDAYSVIGTLQLFAIIGTALLTGAGAAVFLLEFARSRQRPARAA